MQTQLADYRRQKNITMRELAEDIGVSPATIHKIEKNIGYRTTRNVLQWCRKNNYDPIDVFPPDQAT